MKAAIFVITSILLCCQPLVCGISNKADAGTDSLGFVGRKISAEKRTWIDDSTGYEITQWTRNSENHHPYFTIESFIDDSTALLFSKRTGKLQLYRLNLMNGEMTQITNADNLRNLDHLPQWKTVWYLDGTQLYSLNTTTLKSTYLHSFESFGHHVGSFSVTCDAKWLVFSANKKLPVASDCGYGPFAIYKLNLESKSLVQITMDMGFNIGHVQTNPVDPNLVLYCWQWEKFDRPKLVGHAPIRIWWLNIDGTDGGPLAQEYGTQRTHETWTADGKNIAYVSKYRWGAKIGKHFLGIQSIDGKVNEKYYEQVSPSHQNIFKDDKHWVVDSYNSEGKYLVMFTRGNGKMDKTEILFRHDSSLEGQDSHPHPRFSPNGRYILFSTDKTGIPQVYTVRVDLDKRK
jgi:oligogalacturonide lyase